MRIAVAAVLPLLLLAACGSETGPADRAQDPKSAPGPAATMPTGVPAADGPVQTRHLATVLDDGDGPELCLGAVMESYPPQCAGPPVAGWEWTDHPEHERAGGTRWGGFHLTGTFDGTTFTVSEAIPAALYDALPEPDDTDSSPAPGSSTQEERQRIQSELNELPGMLFTSPGTGAVEVEVVHDDGSIQAWADRRYGEGRVAVTSALVPVGQPGVSPSAGAAG